MQFPGLGRLELGFVLPVEDGDRARRRADGQPLPGLVGRETGSDRRQFERLQKPAVAEREDRKPFPGNDGQPVPADGQNRGDGVRGRLAERLRGFFNLVDAPVRARDVERRGIGRDGDAAAGEDRVAQGEAVHIQPIDGRGAPFGVLGDERDRAADAHGSRDFTAIGEVTFDGHGLKPYLPQRAREGTREKTMREKTVRELIGEVSDDSLDAIHEFEDVEIHEKTQMEFGEFEVCLELSFVNSFQMLHGFEFQDNRTVHP